MWDNIKFLDKHTVGMIMQIHTNYILPIINQGISDGTIETDYPEQLAELILLAANI